MDGWTVRHGRAAAVTDCNKVAQGGADRCGCSFCRNCALQRSTAFLVEILRLVERLGVDAGKEHEVYEIGPAANGPRLYAEWFCFFGDFARSEERPTGAFDAFRFGFGFTSSLPESRDSRRDASGTIEFSVPLPWLLSDESQSEPAAL